MTVLGTDISYWQTNKGSTKGIDFDKMSKGNIKFVFIRAYYGTVIDERFLENWNKSKISGILRGAYHYARLASSYDTQITMLVNTLKDDPGELPVALDLEKAYNNLTRSSTLSFIQKFKKDIKEKLNKEIILYTNPSIIKEYLKPAPQWLLNTDLWVANYGTSKPDMGEWKTWKFWQYTNQGIGKNYGVESASIDLDYFNGNDNELLAYAGQNTEIEEPTNPLLTVEERLTKLENWAIIKGYEK